MICDETFGISPRRSQVDQFSLLALQSSGLHQKEKEEMKKIVEPDFEPNLNDHAKYRNRLYHWPISSI